MAKRKTSSDRIIDIDTQRPKKRADKTPVDMRTHPIEPPIATYSGIQVAVRGERKILPPHDPVLWRQMWQMLFEELRPHYLAYIEEQEHAA